MMRENINLGRRIKYFRKRANLTQLELELKCNFAQGLISRIEKNRVNPTKETIKQIAKVLNLNQRELDYLIGETALPASDEEIEEAKKDVEDYFKKRGVFAYLVDDRARFLKFSDTFIKFVGFTNEDLTKIHNQTVINFLIKQKDIVNKLIPKQNYIEILELQIKIYLSALSFMNDDRYFQESIKLIKTDPIASKIYKQTTNTPQLKLANFKQKLVSFKIFKGHKVQMHYYCEPLLTRPRFRMTEYIPTNKILRLLAKLK